MRDSVADMSRRLIPARDPRNASTRLDPASLPSSLLGVGFAGPELTANELLTGAPPPLGEASGPTAWTIEVAYTSDHRFDEVVSAELLAKQERGFRVILRVDYERKQPVPPVDDPVAVQAYVDTFLRLYDMTDGQIRYFIVGNEGNVDSAGDDPSRVTECLAGRAACSPESYVQVYRRVRAALRSRTSAYVLVGAPSPGAARDDPMRYVDGATYLSGILGLLHPLEVDGVALHAYGGAATAQDPPTAESLGLREFVAALESQIRAVADAGLVSTPIFLTEMNQAGSPHPDFIRGALEWIDQHNRRSAQDIVSANWFVYHDELDQWRQYALENRPAIVAVFREAAPMPPGR